MLGIAKDADQKAIKDAFRNLALKYHPDRNKEPGAEARFKGIAEAYAVLSDPKKRAEYDARGFAGVAGFSQQDLFEGINFEDIFGGLNFDFGGGSPFEGLFRRRRTGPPRGANIEVDLFVPLERVASGGEEQVRLGRPAPAPLAAARAPKAGLRRAPAKRAEAAAASLAAGRRKRARPDSADHYLPRLPWARQHHRTPLPQMPRQRRDGTGRSPDGQDPARRGGRHGTAHPRQRDAESGDGRHQRGFVRGGAYAARSAIRARRCDLLRQETISLTDAVLGATLEVPTLSGSASVSIPPGTQPGAVLRLKGKGLPEFGSARHGELYLRIEVQVPEQLSREERELYERLRTIGRSRPAKK